VRGNLSRNNCRWITQQQPTSLNLFNSLPHLLYSIQPIICWKWYSNEHFNYDLVLIDSWIQNLRCQYGLWNWVQFCGTFYAQIFICLKTKRNSSFMFLIVFKETWKNKNNLSKCNEKWGQQCFPTFLFWNFFSLTQTDTYLLHYGHVASVSHLKRIYFQFIIGSVCLHFWKPGQLVPMKK